MEAEAPVDDLLFGGDAAPASGIDPVTRAAMDRKLDGFNRDPLASKLTYEASAWPDRQSISHKNQLVPGREFQWRRVRDSLLGEGPISPKLEAIYSLR
jgi:hypothetical protein